MCSTPKQSLPHWAALICESLQTQLMELTANPCLLCRRTFTFYLMLFPVRLLGKMLKKLTYPEFDLSRIIYSTDYKPTCLPTILSCVVSQLLTVLFCLAPIPTIQITLSISTSVLHSLVCPHLLFTALPYASICLNCKCGNLSSLAPVPSYRGRVPETMLGWSLKSRDEIIWELTCSTIYLKCKWNSDFFFFSEVYVLARFEEREKWKLIQLQIKPSYWASFPASKWGTAVQTKELQEFWLKEIKLVCVRLFPNLMDQICWSLQSHHTLG